MADLVKALNAKLAADPNFSVEKFFGVAVKPATMVAQKNDAKVSSGKNPQLKEADIKESYIQHLQKLVKAEMQAADENWDSWASVK